MGLNKPPYLGIVKLTFISSNMDSLEAKTNIHCTRRLMETDNTLLHVNCKCMDLSKY